MEIFAGSDKGTEHVWVISRDVGMLLGGVMEWGFWLVGRKASLTRRQVKYSCMTRYYDIGKAKDRGWGMRRLWGWRRGFGGGLRVLFGGKQEHAGGGEDGAMREGVVCECIGCLIGRAANSGNGKMYIYDL